MAVNEFFLDILGTKFTITVEEEEAYLQEILNQYRAAIENTKSISGMNDALNIAVLTGFLLCDEINKMRQRTQEKQTLRDGEDLEAEERTKNLIARLDQALNRSAGNE